MPRNVFSLADTFGAGERDRQRNALLEQQRAAQERENALFSNPETTPEQFARGGRSDVANALTSLGSNERISKQEALEQLAGVAQRALQLDPVNRRQLAKEAMTVYAPAFQALSGGQPNALKFDAMSDQELEQALQRVASFAPAGGQQEAGFTLSPGQTRFDAQGRPVGSVAPTPEKPKPQFRPMTAEEVVGAGLPPGTSAQVNDDTGQISVLSKPGATQSLSQKDQATAKIKLTTINIARKQLNNIRKRFEEVKGISAGPFGQGRLPTESGNAFDRAVDQMRSTLTSLTRVPGIGAMSDFETRLDQAKFPARTDFEDVTEQQIDGLDSLLNGIETGYRDLLSGNQPAQDETQPTAPQATAPVLRYVPGQGFVDATR